MLKHTSVLGFYKWNNSIFQLLVYLYLHITIAFLVKCIIFDLLYFKVVIMLPIYKTGEYNASISMNATIQSKVWFT